MSFPSLSSLIFSVPFSLSVSLFLGSVTPSAHAGNRPAYKRKQEGPLWVLAPELDSLSRLSSTQKQKVLKSGSVLFVSIQHPELAVPQFAYFRVNEHSGEVRLDHFSDFQFSWVNTHLRALDLRESPEGLLYLGIQNGSDPHREYRAIEKILTQEEFEQLQNQNSIPPEYLGRSFTLAESSHNSEETLKKGFVEFFQPNIGKQRVYLPHSFTLKSNEFHFAHPQKSSNKGSNVASLPAEWVHAPILFFPKWDSIEQPWAGLVGLVTTYSGGVLRGKQWHLWGVPYFIGFTDDSVELIRADPDKAVHLKYRLTR